MKIEQITYRDVLMLAAISGNVTAELAIESAWECCGAMARDIRYHKVWGAIWPEIPKNMLERRYRDGPVRDPKTNKGIHETLNLQKELKAFKPS